MARAPATPAGDLFDAAMMNLAMRFKIGGGLQTPLVNAIIFFAFMASGTGMMAGRPRLQLADLREARHG
jgi:hypothetical protein